MLAKGGIEKRLQHLQQRLLNQTIPHSVALVQLRIASLAVTCLRRNLLPQECALAGRTKKRKHGVCHAFIVRAQF